MTEIAERNALTTKQRLSLRNHLSEDREQTRLLAERLRADLGAFIVARRDSPTDDEHDPEGPTLAFERSQSDALLRQTAQHLADIDAALTRLEDGSYGRCSRCGNHIAVGRLRARPQTPHCIRCAEIAR